MRKGFFAETMKGMIGVRCLSVAVLMATALPAAAQFSVTTEDPFLAAAYITGSTLEINEIQTGTGYKLSTEMLEGAITAKFNQIKKWQQKESDYLKDASKFAQAIKAGTTLATTCLKTLRNLNELRKAANNNPEGIVTSTVMNNLYLETLVEFIKTYRMLEWSVTKGKEKNMLTGKERAETMWMLVDRIEELNEKIHTLALSVAFWNFKLSFMQLSIGYGVYDTKRIGDICIEKWRNSYKALENIK